MDGTRQYWATSAIGMFLAAISVLYAEPLLLAGTVGVGAWLLSRQYAFVRTLVQIDSELTISQTTSASRVRTDEVVTVTLAGRTDEPANATLEVTGQPPVSITTGSTDARTAIIRPGETSEETTYTVRPNVAGRVAFGPSRLQVTDSLGLFTETLYRGQTPSLVVEPRRPQNLHVGIGGDHLADAYGEHSSERVGTGLEPAEIRKYVSGDPANQIEWKATARLGTPHVRELQAETDRQTVLLVDGRHSLALGPPGETAFDYLREAALTVVDAARDLHDPLGCYAIGNEGIILDLAPDSTGHHFRSIQNRLHALEPTAQTEESGGTPLGSRPGTRPSAFGRAGSPEAARRAAVRLDGDDSTFATRLSPLLESTDVYVTRIAERPLFRTAQTRVNRLRGHQWTVLLTDDSGRAETRETVKLLRRGDGHVLALLAPRILFEPGGFADIEDAYASYLDFESFRRNLDVLDRVTALEVGPGDRLAALLSSRRRLAADGGH